MCIYLFNAKKLEKHTKNTEKQQPLQQKDHGVNILVSVVSFFFPSQVCVHLCSLSSIRDTVQNLLCFFNLAIDGELLPVDELLLKIDVPVEAVMTWASRFITILLFKK